MYCLWQPLRVGRISLKKSENKIAPILTPIYKFYSGQYKLRNLQSFGFGLRKVNFFSPVTQVWSLETKLLATLWRKNSENTYSASRKLLCRLFSNLPHFSKWAPSVICHIALPVHYWPTSIMKTYTSRKLCSAGHISLKILGNETNLQYGAVTRFIVLEIHFSGRCSEGFTAPEHTWGPGHRSPDAREP